MADPFRVICFYSEAKHRHHKEQQQLTMNPPQSCMLLAPACWFLAPFWDDESSNRIYPQDPQSINVYQHPQQVISSALLIGKRLPNTPSWRVMI